MTNIPTCDIITMQLQNNIGLELMLLVKPFYEFEQYLAEHWKETAYDASHNLKDSDFPSFFISPTIQEPLQDLIRESCLAYLRAYHKWMNETQIQ